MVNSKDKKKQEQSASTPPGGFRVIVREFTKDKLALASFFILVTVLLASLYWCLSIGSGTSYESKSIRTLLGTRG